MLVQCRVNLSLSFLDSYTSTLYFLKIEEGLTLEACFGSVQGLNQFHTRSKYIIHKIEGCTLDRTRITIKDTSMPANALLFVSPSATFKNYKSILDNHIQSILNFYEVRYRCGKLKLSKTECSFDGGINAPTDFEQFKIWKRLKSESLSDIQDLFPISVKIEHFAPLPSLWRQVSNKSRLLWTKYNRLRILLDECDASVDFNHISIFHKRTLSFESHESTHNISAKDIYDRQISMFPSLR